MVVVRHEEAHTRGGVAGRCLENNISADRKGRPAPLESQAVPRDMRQQWSTVDGALAPCTDTKPSFGTKGVDQP